MLSNSLDLVVFITFIINLFIATFLMARKYFTNQNKIQPELKNLLYRLFVVQTSVTFGMHIQMPYKYQLYLENGLTHLIISKIICYHHIITGVWNIFLPFAIKRFGHRLLIMFASFCFGISSLIIGYSNESVNFFILASCFSGLTMPTIMRCFQDIWQLEEKRLPTNWKANFVYNETRSLISLITTWIVSPLSSFIASRYGTRMIFNFSSILIFISIVPTFILIKDPITVSNNENNKNNELRETDVSLVEKQFKEHKITYYVIFLDVVFSIGMFLFHQRSSAFLLTPVHKPPMGFVSGTYGVLDLIGAQIILLFSHLFSYQVWLSVFSFLMGIFMILMFFVYENKIFVFIFICMNSFVSSGFMANVFFLHKQYYPSNLRNYFMSLIRVPTSIISFLIMWFWRSENIEYYAAIAGLLLLVSSILCILLNWLDGNSHRKQSDEKMLLDSDLNRNDEKDSDIGLKNFDDDEKDVNFDENGAKIKFEEEEKSQPEFIDTENK